MTTTSEKERTYAELAALRRRVFLQRQEITALIASSTVQENAKQREKAQRYRKALSNIRYRLDNSDLTEDALRSIVVRALGDFDLSTKGGRAAFHRELGEKHTGARLS